MSRPKVTITVELGQEQAVFTVDTPPNVAVAIFASPTREARHARNLLINTTADAQRWLTARAGGE